MEEVALMALPPDHENDSDPSSDSSDDSNSPEQVRRAKVRSRKGVDNLPSRLQEYRPKAFSPGLLAMEEMQTLEYMQPLHETRHIRKKGQANGKAASERSASRPGASAQAHNTLSSRSSAREQRLREIVKSAVKRAEELHDPYLGKAFQEIFNRSLHDRAMADLLDVVFSQKPTVEQTSTFRAIVKQTQKEIKEAEKQALRQPSSAPGSSLTSSLELPSKGDGSSGVRCSMTTEDNQTSASSSRASQDRGVSNDGSGKEKHFANATKHSSITPPESIAHVCLEPGCPSSFARAYDLRRHIKTHFPATPKRNDQIMKVPCHRL